MEDVVGLSSINDCCCWSASVSKFGVAVRDDLVSSVAGVSVIVVVMDFLPFDPRPAVDFGFLIFCVAKSKLGHSQ